jgi:hypothetical protein
MFEVFAISVPIGPSIYDGDTVHVNENGIWVETRQGEGKCTWADGSFYKGNWWDGKMHGQGTLKLCDGTTYEGQWCEDLMHGNGKLVTRDMTTVIGYWHAGRLHGAGTISSFNRPTYHVKWHHGTLIYDNREHVAKDERSNLAWLNIFLVGAAFGCGVTSLFVTD